MKIKLIVMLVSLTTIVTSGVVMGVKNTETESAENTKESKTSITRNMESNEENNKVADTKNEIIEEKKDVEENTKLENKETSTDKSEKKIAKEQTTKKTTSKDTNNEKKTTSNSNAEAKETNKTSNENKTEQPKKVVDENASTGTEGMRNKYEDAGTLTINENSYDIIAGGYAISYKYAIVDLIKGKITIVDHYEILDSVWNSFTEQEKAEEGPKVVEDKKEYKLSQEEIDRLYDMYMNAQDNIDANDVYSFELYRDNMFDRQIEGHWDYEDDMMDDYYFTIDSTNYNEKVFVFDNIQNVRFLYNLLEK